MAGSSLRSCVNCGHTVSQSAVLCPKCGGLARGEVCYFCGRERPLASLGHSIGVPSVYFCEECVQQRFSPPADQACSDCGAHLPQRPARELLACYFPDGVAHAPMTCPSCGSTSPWGRDITCGICSLPIFAFQRRIRYRDSTGRERHGFCQRRRAGCFGVLLVALALTGAVFILVFLL